MAEPASAAGAFAVTPSDSATIGARALYVGGAGDVAVKTRSRTASVTLVGVPAGTILPIQVTQVLATGTTATNIVGLT